jgi:hypothetical protein
MGSHPGFVNYKKGCTRLAAASVKVYQWLAHGRWFSPGNPDFSISSYVVTGKKMFLHFHDLYLTATEHSRY